MALTLPSAPKNFYDPSLNTLKTKLETVNGSTKGQFVLLTGIPANIEDCWSEVGVGGDTLDGANRGSLVVANLPVAAIGDPELGPEETPGENGYKIVFDEINGVPVYIDGSGTSTAVVIGAALVEGVDVFSSGIADNVKYLLKVNNLTVTDGGLINVPSFEIILNYSKIAI